MRVRVRHREIDRDRGRGSERAYPRRGRYSDPCPPAGWGDSRRHRRAERAARPSPAIHRSGRGTRRQRESRLFDASLPVMPCLWSVHPQLPAGYPPRAVRADAAVGVYGVAQAGGIGPVSSRIDRWLHPSRRSSPSQRMVVPFGSKLPGQDRPSSPQARPSSMPVQAQHQLAVCRCTRTVMTEVTTERVFSLGRASRCDTKCFVCNADNLQARIYLCQKSRFPWGLRSLG